MTWMVSGWTAKTGRPARAGVIFAGPSLPSEPVLRRFPSRKATRTGSEWTAFHRDLFVEHVTNYTNAVHALKPGCLVVSNWMYTLREPEPVKAPIDYLSGDFPYAWGADDAAAEGRMMDARGMSWDLMAWGFARASEDSPFNFKTALHLDQELSEVVALGGAVMIYENPQRSGWLTGWHNEIMAQVGEFCRAREEVMLSLPDRSPGGSAPPTRTLLREH